MKHYLQKIVYVALLAFVISACSKDKDEERPLSERVTFETTGVVKGSAYSYVEVRINGTVGNPIIFINGIQAEGKGQTVETGTASTITVEVPFNVGSGRIELQDRTERIPGPMFEYVPTYTAFTSEDLTGTSMARYTDNSLVVWDANNKLFSIVEFGQLNASETPSITLTRQKQTTPGIPDSDLEVRRVGVPSIGMAVGPDKDVFFYQEYFDGVAGSSTTRHQLLATNFTSTGYVLGYGTADFGPITDVEIDSKGNIFTCEADKFFIRKQNGAIESFAGSTTAGHRDGTGTAAQFTHINAMTLDKADNLYVADGRCIRKITPAGVVTTIAGSTEEGNVDGAAPDARFGNVMGLYMAPDGKLYIADTGNYRVRVLDTDGQVTTLVDAAISAISGAKTFHLFVDTHGNIFTMSPHTNSYPTVFITEANMTAAQFETTRYANADFDVTLEEK
jgi:hypothetical protein